jgi:hypothetical protein
MAAQSGEGCVEAELQTMIARLSAHRFLPRTDSLVRRALTDDAFHAALTERLANCGLELVEHPYADNVCLRLKRDLEQPVFGREDAWLSNNLGLKSDQIALLVVLWALLILPKRQRQIERREHGDAQQQAEMFVAGKPVPSGADLAISVSEATLLADFGDRLGRSRIKQFSLPVLSRLRFIDRRDGRIYEGPLLDLAFDYNRIAGRVLDGALTELLGQRLDQAATGKDTDIATHAGPSSEDLA